MAGCISNDVGQVSWEEVNEGVAGANYGWPVAEGFDGGNAAYRDPLAAYSHSTGTPTGCAITGGAFLTGGNYPSQYNNAYFYADICSQWIYYLPAPGLHSNSLRDQPGQGRCRLAGFKWRVVLPQPRQRRRIAREIHSSEPGAALCAGYSLPAHAQAYSLNATVVPSGPLGFLTLWPSGQPHRWFPR